MKRIKTANGTFSIGDLVAVNLPENWASIPFGSLPILSKLEKRCRRNSTSASYGSEGSVYFVWYDSWAPAPEYVAIVGGTIIDPEWIVGKLKARRGFNGEIIGVSQDG